MKGKGNISRKQFLTGSASVVFGAIFGKLSEHVYAEEKPENTSRENSVNTGAEERDWDELPLDMLSGAYLVSDPESELFGETVEAEEYLLTQYFHVYPGLELMLTDTGEGGGKGGWVGFSKDLKPNAVLRTGAANAGTGKKTLASVPEGVYYLRGSGKVKPGHPQAWVRNFSLYALNCGLNKPDLSDYTEITELSLDQRSRTSKNGKFDSKTQDCPSLGDVFFSPIDTDIILTFNNANIAPYIYSGDNYNSVSRKNIFTRHYGFGFAWYHCKTTEIGNYLGAFYETAGGIAKALPLDELRAAEPHLYIRFPSRASNTLAASIIRTTGVTKNHQRLFTVVHLTDTHGDMDSTHAAYEYADQIGADFVALTGDNVPYGAYHGYDILHTLIRNAKTPTVYAAGNHDVYSLTDQQFYEKEIAPIKSTLRASLEHPYYYRDFLLEEGSVRVISLYPFYDKAKTRKYGYYTQEQLSWLCDALATVPDGGHIFLLRHFTHHKPILTSNEKAMFYDYEDSNTEKGLDLWLGMGADPITEIIDAYNDRKIISARYSGELKDGTETVSVDYDFTDRPNSEFVAYFSGHVHVDSVGYARGTRTRQAVLCSLCTTGVKGTAAYRSYTSFNAHRDYGTDSQIAFNVFSFDFKKEKIYAARVGNGLYKDFEKTWMELSYKK